MAEWMKRRNKIRNIFALIRDQTAAGLLRANGSFLPTQTAVVMATNHDENLPEEKYVEEIIAVGSGSRMQVSNCTRALVKRLSKTEDWVVAIKCLVVLHRTILDGGFLFQDQLAFHSSREGRDYLNFVNSRDDLSSLDWELSFWVKLYAKYLDDRLICSRVLKCHFDSKWSIDKIRNRVPYMVSEELLEELVALQNLVHELCLCHVGPEAGENFLVQGALVLVVSDSTKLQEEIRYRIQEMLERVGSLPLSEGLSLLQICRRAIDQMHSLRKFLEGCKELSLLSDLPLPEKAWVSMSDMEKLGESFKTPTAPLYARRSVSSAGRSLGENLLLEKAASGSSNRKGQGMLQRTASQPMAQPRRLRDVNGMLPRESPYTDSNLQNLPNLINSCPDLIDLSYDTALPDFVEVPFLSRELNRDLITWSPREEISRSVTSTNWENILLNSMIGLPRGGSQKLTNSSLSIVDSSSTDTMGEDGMYRTQVK